MAKRLPNKSQPWTGSAADFLPARLTWKSARAAAAGCKGCPLYIRATQTVFGEGATHARVLLLGEQPGDKEDMAGRPFVGPAGVLLYKALTAAGIDRADAYVTNAVKHFKWEPRGKRRIHDKPNAMEINACRAWLEAEVGLLQPEVIVCLGATAAQSLLGKSFRVTQQRGEVIHGHALAPAIVATVHPSSILRAPDADTRHAEMAHFIDDLRVVARLLHRHRRAA